MVGLCKANRMRHTELSGLNVAAGKNSVGLGPRVRVEGFLLPVERGSTIGGCHVGFYVDCPH